MTVAAVTPPRPRRPSVAACEVCRKEVAVSLSWFADKGNWYGPASGVWKLAGLCTVERENYYVMIPDFLRAPERWRSHLREKRWFSERDFDAMLARYAAEAGSLEPPRLRMPKGRAQARSRQNTKPIPKALALPKLEASLEAPPTP
jgi:hypothetical protein